MKNSLINLAIVLFSVISLYSQSPSIQLDLGEVKHSGDYIEFEVLVSSKSSSTIKLINIQPQIKFSGVDLSRLTSPNVSIIKIGSDFEYLNKYHAFIDTYNGEKFLRFTHDPYTNGEALNSLSDTPQLLFRVRILIGKEPIEFSFSKSIPNITANGFVDNNTTTSVFALSYSNLFFGKSESNNSVSSTSDKQNNEISVSPNPTTDLIRVDISSLINNRGDIDMQIVDAAGAIVMTRELAKTSTSHSISLATLTPAPYFVKLIQDGKTYTKSVIKLQQ